MAAPSFFGAGALATATSGSSIGSVGFPASIAADDVAILCFYSNVSRTLTVPSGWTALGTGVANATFSRFWAWRRLDGSETALSVAFTGGTASTTNVCGARIYVYRGCVTSGDPYEDPTLSSLTTSQTPAASTIDTTGVDRLVVCLLGIDNDAEAADWSTMPATGWTLNGTIGTWNQTGDGTILGVSKTQATAATVSGTTIGTYTITSSPSPGSAQQSGSPTPTT